MWSSATSFLKSGDVDDESSAEDSIDVGNVSLSLWLTEKPSVLWEFDADAMLPGWAGNRCMS